MTTKNIYDLKLHEGLTIDRYTLVQRVPSGWIYMVRSDEDSQYLAVFVPDTINPNID